MERNLRGVRCFAYSLFIFLLYVISGVPSVIPELFGSKPCVLIPMALTIAVFENERVSMIFGAVCGILTDLGFSNTVGYFAVFLTVICFFIGFFSDNLIVGNLLNTMIISLCATVVLIGLYFVFFYLFTGFENAGRIFVNHYISKIIYTIVLVPAFYFLNRTLYFGLDKS